MKLKRIAEACLWLPGFAPAEDPIEVLGTIPARSTAEIIPLFQPAKAKAAPKTKPVWPKLKPLSSPSFPAKSRNSTPILRPSS